MKILGKLKLKKSNFKSLFKEKHSSHMEILISEQNTYLLRQNRSLDLINNNMEKIHESINHRNNFYFRTIDDIRFALCNRDGAPNGKLGNISRNLDDINARLKELCDIQSSTDKQET